MTSRQNRVAPIWGIPLRRFLLADRRGGTVMATQDYIDRFEAMMLEKWPSIQAASARLFADDKIPARPVPGSQDAVFKSVGASWHNGIIAIRGAKTRRLMAWQQSGSAYVHPKYRGRGLGRDLCRISFEIGHKDIGSFAFFAPGGLGSRKAAHREAVRDALRAGEPVPPNVVADYPAFA